mmetsp:Transcript_99553/g.277112  ORF Transcript_99553/g.277112 Transcript_99553/m.277112 type:complete len:234 (+) Transcript_99553:1988-2689(+)
MGPLPRPRTVWRARILRGLRKGRRSPQARVQARRHWPLLAPRRPFDVWRRHRRELSRQEGRRMPCHGGGRPPRVEHGRSRPVLEWYLYEKWDARLPLYSTVCVSVAQRAGHVGGRDEGGHARSEVQGVGPWTVSQQRRGGVRDLERRLEPVPRSHPLRRGRQAPVIAGRVRQALRLFWAARVLRLLHAVREQQRRRSWRLLAVPHSGWRHLLPARELLEESRLHRRRVSACAS